MNIIATLGPQGTYSELATLKYIESQCDSYEIQYFDSIKKTLESVGNSCNFGVIPIENLSEGFVSLVLDLLAETNLTIVSEVILPIKFSFVSMASSVSEIDKLYVQFVAKSQCSDFISTLNNVDSVTTESNIESLDLILKNAGLSSAIVPANSYEPSQFNIVIDDVTDYENNQTRFIILTDVKEQLQNTIGSSKTSMVILDDDDHAGLLGDILSSFSNRNINLLSIISRPTRKVFGKYNFFIDIEGHINDALVFDAVEEIKRKNKVKTLGSYPVA